MATELSVADAIESGSNMIRVLRDELAANDTAETGWTPGAKLHTTIELEHALAITVSPAPVNDDGFVAEFDLASVTDADALLAADDEFAAVCDERRDAWLARAESEEECD